jgi:hypothetical protein
MAKRVNLTEITRDKTYQVAGIGYYWKHGCAEEDCQHSVSGISGKKFSYIIPSSILFCLVLSEFI